jgi:UDPglucose 6-dehydrogenase
VDILVIGLGYVGSVAAAALSKSGHHVTAVDINREKIDSLRQGQTTIKEPGLLEIVQDSFKNNILEFQYLQDIENINESVVMICVGTPSKAGGDVDLSQVYTSIDWIIAHSSKSKTIIMKSTVPPGTGDSIVHNHLLNYDIHHSFIMNPEFLREGQAVSDWFSPDRIVIGGTEKKAIDITSSLYSNIRAPTIITDLTTAETIKYAANAFLATKISFINEIAKLCECIGGDITKVSEGIGLDKRIGTSFLKAGIGYGGSCFPKDTRALDATFSKYDLDFSLLKAVIDVNNNQRQLAITKLKRALGDLKNKTIAVLGLAFKPKTDDVREAPSIDIIRLLCKEGAIVHAYDPVAITNAKMILPSNVEFADSAFNALSGSCAVIIVTEWEEFIKLDWQSVKIIMKEPYVIVDGRNCLSPYSMKKYGFKYAGFGL